MTTESALGQGVKTMATAETLTTTSVSHWIDGELVASTSGRSGVVTNPATGEVIAEVGFATGAESGSRRCFGPGCGTWLALKRRLTPHRDLVPVSPAAGETGTSRNWPRSSAAKMARRWP